MLRETNKAETYKMSGEELKILDRMGREGLPRKETIKELKEPARKDLGDRIPGLQREKSVQRS